MSFLIVRELIRRRINYKELFEFKIVERIKRSINDL